MKMKMDFRPVVSRYSLVILAAATFVFYSLVTSNVFADDTLQSRGAMIMAQNGARSQNGNRPSPPSPEAINACEAKAENSRCSFNDVRSGVAVKGTCITTPRGEAACAANSAK